ncbi:Protein dgcr6 [Halocaridina rubra]|uniref:Protein dgcr6 n=1 Tax=Halocaridina rubra TaxID=373956 RepID=A0AAN8ZXU2_HALRR
MHSGTSSDTQERLYKMLENLQNLARQIPTKFQQRLPYDLLSPLAHVLLDNTVFEIVRELVELQHMTEKSLHQQRMHLINKHRVEKESLIKQHREEILAAERQGKAHVAARLPRLHGEQLTEMERRHAQEVSNCHERILQLLDQKAKIKYLNTDFLGMGKLGDWYLGVVVLVQLF